MFIRIAFDIPAETGKNCSGKQKTTHRFGEWHTPDKVADDQQCRQDSYTEISSDSIDMRAPRETEDCSNNKGDEKRISPASVLIPQDKRKRDKKHHADRFPEKVAYIQTGLIKVPKHIE
jgi:hypothetical protein